MKKICLLFSLFFIISCTTSSDNWFVRFWNDGIRLSKSEMNKSKQCLEEAYKKYPDKENEYYKRMEYERVCMKK